MQNQHPEEEIENSLTHAAGERALADVDDGLTYKQRLFVQAYLGEAKGNATAAARIAGYAGNDATLGVTGFDTLRSPKVVAQVRARARMVMGEHETLEHLAAVIRKDDLDYAQEYRNKHGAVVGVRLDMNAKVKAIETMMRYHGMLVDKVEHSGTIEQQVRQIVVNVTADARQPQHSAVESQASSRQEEDTE
jgi:phage terminase small subunit